jgi:hypothetical protein
MTRTAERFSVRQIVTPEFAADTAILPGLARGTAERYCNVHGLTLHGQPEWLVLDEARDQDGQRLFDEYDGEHLPEARAFVVTFYAEVPA